MTRSFPAPTRSQLIELARSAANVAYCPYSSFHVGAAVLAGGQFFTGCNVENASYGLTTCAERSAIFKAVAGGEKVIDAIAVSCPDATTGGLSSERMPCGACRQVIAEFASSSVVIIVDGVGDFTLDDLLPNSFILKSATVQDNRGTDAKPPLPRICIDIDNVVADTDPVIRQIIADFTAGRVSFNYEDIKAFDYRKCKDSRGETLRRSEGESKDEWEAVHDIFSSRVLDVEPYPGIQEILCELTQYFELHLATSRLYQARSHTAEWLCRHSFPNEIRLHFLRSGEKHLSLGHFFASVEDDLSQAIAFAKAGVHSFLLAHPWNVVDESALVHRCLNWDEIANQLRNLAGTETT